MARRKRDDAAPAPPWFVDPVPPRPLLTQSRIVEAAHELVHDGGIDALSLRALARELGVGTTQLHRRIERKEHLMVAVADLVLSEVEVPSHPVRSAAWRTSLRRFSLEIRRVLEAHPHVHPVLDSYVLITPAAVRIAERGVASIEAAGFRGDRLVDAYNAWAGYVFGFSVMEMQPRQQREERAQLRRWVHGYLRGLDEDDYPAISGSLERLENRALGLRWEAGLLGPKGTSFAVGLDAMLDGLAARIDARRR
jgi:TetR/AcrR family transcriptional regulator, tetracycline repressor protein